VKPRGERGADLLARERHHRGETDRRVQRRRLRGRGVGGALGRLGRQLLGGHGRAGQLHDAVLRVDLVHDEIAKARLDNARKGYAAGAHVGGNAETGLVKREGELGGQRGRRFGEQQRRAIGVFRRLVVGALVVVVVVAAALHVVSGRMRFGPERKRARAETRAGDEERGGQQSGAEHAPADR
jgi:hypothetical protein